MATRPAYVYNGSGWDDIGDKRIGAEAGDIPQASVEDLTSDLASKQADVMTTKGDLAAYGTDVDRLAVGTNGQVLTADSGETLGVKWADASGGLTLITSESFSAVSSVSVNNCFTSTYANYRIVLTVPSRSTSLALTMRLRASGSDETAANYRWAYSFKTDWTGAIGASGATNATSFQVIAAGFSNVLWTNDVAGPQLAQGTSIVGSVVEDRGGLGYGGYHNDTGQYDGFTISANTGNFTGNVRVYGYQNS